MSAPRTPAVYGRDALVALVRDALSGGRVVALVPWRDEPGLGLTTVARRVAAVVPERWAWSRAVEGPWPHRALRRALTATGRPLPAVPTRAALVEALALGWRARPPELIVLDGVGAAEAPQTSAILAARPRGVPALVTADSAAVAEDLGAHAIEVGPLDAEAVRRWMGAASVPSGAVARAWEVLAGGRPLVWHVLTGGRLPPLPDDVVVDGAPALAMAYTARALTLDRTTLRVLHALSVAVRREVDDERASALAGVTAGGPLGRLVEAGFIVQAPTSGRRTLPRAIGAMAAQEALREGVVRVVRDRQQSWVSAPSIAGGSGLVDAVEVLRRVRASGHRAALDALVQRIGDVVGAQVPEAVDPATGILDDADGEPTRVMRRHAIPELELGEDSEIDLGDPLASAGFSSMTILPTDDRTEDVVDLESVDDAFAAVQAPSASMRKAPERDVAHDEDQTVSLSRRSPARETAADEQATLAMRRPLFADDALDATAAATADARPAYLDTEQSTAVLGRTEHVVDGPEATVSVRAVRAGAVAPAPLAAAPPPTALPEDSDATHTIRGRRLDARDASPMVRWLALANQARDLAMRLERVDGTQVPASVSRALADARSCDPTSVTHADVGALEHALWDAQQVAEVAEVAARAAWDAEAEAAIAALSEAPPVLLARPALAELAQVWDGARVARRDAEAAAHVARRAFKAVRAAESYGEARSAWASAQAAERAAADARARFDSMRASLDMADDRIREALRQRREAALAEAASIVAASARDVERVLAQAPNSVQDVVDDELAEARASLAMLRALEAQAPAVDAGRTVDGLRRAGEAAEAHADDVARAADAVRAACDEAAERLAAEAARRDEARRARCAEAVARAEAAAAQVERLATERPVTADGSAATRIATRLLAALSEIDRPLRAARAATAADAAESAADAAEALCDRARAARHALGLCGRGEAARARDQRAWQALRGADTLAAATTWSAVRDAGDAAVAWLDDSPEAHALREAWGALRVVDPASVGSSLAVAARAVAHAAFAQAVGG